MPLAALTPVLNDLLHKGGSSGNPTTTPQHQVDGTNPNEYHRQGSSVHQSSNVINALSNEEDDVSRK